MSLETSIDEPPPRDNLQSQGTRRKDRMTYIHDGIQVDLTQVRTVDVR